MDIWDQINQQSADALTSIRSIITVVAVVLVLIYAGKRGWQVTAFIVGGLLAALLLFFTWGGLDVVRGWFEATFV